MDLTSGTDLKVDLDFASGDTREDAKLSFLITLASSWIFEMLGRQDVAQAARTEYYDGTGTQLLLLRHRPVLTSPTIQCWVDQSGWWGAASGAFGSSTELTYGTDFSLKIDQPDGTSRSGILVRLNSFWPERTLRQAGMLSPYQWTGHGCVKVTYTAGYTVATLPPLLRGACEFLVARMRYALPLGMEIGSESYEERSISLVTQQKNYLTALVKPMIWPFRNWKW